MNNNMFLKKKNCPISLYAHFLGLLSLFLGLRFPSCFFLLRFLLDLRRRFRVASASSSNLTANRPFVAGFCL
jgi:hypothetical protein